jgi:D-lactate dehydrogenase (cytochrome)
MIVKTNQDEFQSYLSDASNYEGRAEAVYLPESEAEIIALVKQCNRDGVRMTVSGNRTGLTGAGVPEGGIVVSTEKLNKILDINQAERSVCVQPGVILKDLQNHMEAQNLFYPPDPTERNCFVGATAATNSSGARSFKYGPTRDYVLGMRVVLPSGDTLSLERGQMRASGNAFSFKSDQGSPYTFTMPEFKMPQTKNASGYFCKENMDLMDLFIGSEGTLGIITELKLRLLPLPEGILSCVVFFEQENDALCFIDEARTKTKAGSLPEGDKIAARGLEYFDRRALDFLRPDYPAVPEQTCAVWFEQELGENEDACIAAWLMLIQKHHADADKAWVAVERKNLERFKDFRHAISWKVNDFVTRHGLRKVGTDVAVPEAQFPSFYRWMAELVARCHMAYVVYGHFGDCNAHLNMLPKNQNEYDQAKKLYQEICSEAVHRQGTVSAEHGIGKMKRDYLLLMYGEPVIRQMAALKRMFDPHLILNIGNLFEERYLQ